MNKLKQRFQQGKQAIKTLDESRIRGAGNIRAFAYSWVFSFLLFLPVVIVFANLFTLYAPGAPLFPLVATLAGIGVVLFNATANVFYVRLIKKYFKQLPALGSISEWDVFLVECLNLPVWLLVIVVVVFLSVSGGALWL